MSDQRGPDGRIDPERLQRMRVRVAAVSALALTATGVVGCERDRPPAVNSPVTHTINEPVQPTPNTPVMPMPTAAPDVPGPTPNLPPPQPQTPPPQVAAEPDAGAAPPEPRPTINRPPTTHRTINAPRRPPVPPGNG